LHDTVKQVDQVSAVATIGGQRRQVRVDLDESRLSGYHLSPSDVAGALGAANRRLRRQLFQLEPRVVLEAGSFLACADDVRRVVVGVADGRPVFLGDVARVQDGGEEPSQYVRYASAGDPAMWPAVTLAVSKRKGANATAVADRVLARVEALRGSASRRRAAFHYPQLWRNGGREIQRAALPHADLRDFGGGARMPDARPARAGIVFTAIPVTLALTLATFYFYGFTLNRITLFALIFSIGILVDDAIVITRISCAMRACRITRAAAWRRSPLKRSTKSAIPRSSLL
jgi:multidrug efflux pump subunit AcrB